MRVPFNWLREFTPLPAEPGRLGERLTMRGLEVEAVERLRPAFDGVSVGRIVDMAEAPFGGQAFRLQRGYGSGRTHRRVRRAERLEGP